ncbi:MAG TPA: bifunctional adenosylcobinamide kinase/adenosylcobinamide-phosphate guanylyltransferase [Planosporangium sp.]|jgi:adenosyl cobinamide kinase/adenosyl cobinamide phosphate guanylyltransferase/NaMN:DMB phosphoribosyltransferase|nr:bifunctional adenosylcobinamide kinase/adenosylcobinamide-phosphate guanylyltransferase [Planosporangium sp.]
MSWQVGRRVLILGGIRSGKSELAEQLVSGAAEVRYVATAAGSGDPTWTARIAAHRERRPAGWSVEEIGSDPGRLIALLAEAKPDEALLVDDLGGWLTATLDAAGAWDEGARTDGAAAERGFVESLAAAVRDCPAATLVLVSPEVGLSVVAPTAAGRIFADAIGEVNRAVAEACDGVAFVVAGQPAWIKGTDPRGTAAGPATTATAGPAPVAGPVLTPAAATDVTAEVATAAPGPSESIVTDPGTMAWSEADTMLLPALDGTAVTSQPATGPQAIAVGMSLPMPDEAASDAAGERLVNLDVAGAGFGVLAPVVRFAAATQGQPTPRPWQSVRMLLLHADHDGGVAAGDSPAASAGRLAAVERGEGAFALLAGAAGAAVQTVRCPGAGAAIEHTDALGSAEVDAALRYGWELAESAVDAGTDLIVLGATGAGAEAAATAVITMAANGEAAALLGRVVVPGGRIDDLAWMRRCEAVRDALHRVRSRARDPRAILATLGGADHAVATGILLGAVSRRTPVMLDGPVGVAAALVARDFGAQTRHWILLPDTGGHPAVRLGAEVLGVTPVLDLKLGLGEGATALAALPLLRSALTLAATLPSA